MGKQTLENAGKEGEYKNASRKPDAKKAGDHAGLEKKQPKRKRLKAW